MTDRPYCCSLSKRSRSPNDSENRRGYVRKARGLHVRGDNNADTNGIALDCCGPQVLRAHAYTHEQGMLGLTGRLGSLMQYPQTNAFVVYTMCAITTHGAECTALQVYRTAEE